MKEKEIKEILLKVEELNNKKLKVSLPIHFTDGEPAYRNRYEGERLEKYNSYDATFQRSAYKEIDIVAAVQKIVNHLGLKYEVALPYTPDIVFPDKKDTKKK